MIDSTWYEVHVTSALDACLKKNLTCSNLIFTVKSPASKLSRISLWEEDVNEWHDKTEGFTEGAGWKAHMSMAQQTRMRKWKRSWSENRESQIRMTSGRRNSWDNNRVSQRNVKYWGFIFCSSCVGKNKEKCLYTEWIYWGFFYHKS